MSAITRLGWLLVVLVLAALIVLPLPGIATPLSAPTPQPTPDCRSELERVAGTLAAEMRAATVEAVSGTWEAHVEAIQTEAADEQEEWRRARGVQP